MDAKTQYSIITYYYKTILIGKQKRIKQTKDRPKKKQKKQDYSNTDPLCL